MELGEEGKPWKMMYLRVFFKTLVHVKLHLNIKKTVFEILNKKV